ncbi:MAG: response regulator [Sphingobacteriales bacterium]|nr:response regulator [Sphingobacteriales bacterium]
MNEYKYKSIMLIDDSDIDNMVNKHILSKNMVAENIIVFTSANDALTYFSENKTTTDEMLIPKIILLDINMPIMNGFGFLVEFEKITADNLKNTKVIMLTSSVDPNDIRRSKDYSSVISFISKPLSLEHLDEI